MFEEIENKLSDILKSNTPLYQASLIKRAFSWKCIGRQPYSERILSRAVHGVTFSFALDFLDLTTFLRQIFGKIHSSDFLTTFYDNVFCLIPQIDIISLIFESVSGFCLHKDGFLFL